jgi:hypothetical protein
MKCLKGKTRGTRFIPSVPHHPGSLEMAFAIFKTGYKVPLTCVSGFLVRGPQYRECAELSNDQLLLTLF